MPMQSIGSVLEFIGLLKWRINHNYDNVIAITGGEGKGKSYFVAKFAPHLWKAFNIARYSDGNYWYEVKEYYDMMQDEPPGYTACGDETVRAAYRRSAMTKEQRELMRDLYMNREERKNQLWVIPTLRAFDTDIRNHRVAFIIHVPWRSNYDAKPWFDHAWADVWYGEESFFSQISEQSKSKWWEKLGGFPWKPPGKEDVKAYKKMKFDALHERREQRHGVYD
jgi:hypothetical protein